MLASKPGWNTLTMLRERRGKGPKRQRKTIVWELTSWLKKEKKLA